MKHSLCLATAAAIATASLALSFAPAEAAPVAPPLVAQTNGAILQVQRWENFHGDRHNAFRDDGWNDDRRWRRQHQRRQARFQRRQHFYGFPFAFAPPFYPHPGYGNCFRSWDGYLICR